MEVLCISYSTSSRRHLLHEIMDCQLDKSNHNFFHRIQCDIHICNHSQDQHNTLSILPATTSHPRQDAAAHSYSENPSLEVNTMVVEDSSGDILSSEATKEARYQKTRKKIENDDKLTRQFSMEKQEYSSALELLRVAHWNDPDGLSKRAEKLKKRFPLLQKPKRPSEEMDDSEKKI